MKQIRSMAACCVVLCLLQACATREEPAYYVNEMGEVGIADGDLTLELQLVAGAMTQAMMPTVLSGKNMLHPSRLPIGGEPWAVLVELDNRTEEFVDSRLVTDAIRAALHSQGALRVLDDELPLPDASRFVPPGKEKPEGEAQAISGKEEAPSAWRFRYAPQLAPVRTSELLPAGGMPSFGEKRQGGNVEDRISPLPPTSPEAGPALPSHEADGVTPVRMSLLTPSPNAGRLPESKAQKRERMLSLLEEQLKEQDEQGRAPVYAIRTVLLPFASRLSDEARKNLKEPYMFKMLVKDVRSETLKWAGAWEVRKAPEAAGSTREGQ